MSSLLQSCILKWLFVCKFQLYHSVDILPGAVILLKDNQLKMQEITPNTEQLKGRKLL